MKRLEERWLELNHQIGVSPDRSHSWWQFIQSHYNEPQRHYHTLDHLEDMFSHYDKHINKFNRPNLIQLSIFFHDVIYDPTKPDNEERSADAFIQYTREDCMNLSEEDINTVKEWILMTKNHLAEESSEDHSYFLDIDMAVLGRPEGFYMEYADQIRKEYIHFPDSEYNLGRIKVLTRFCDRERIYSTKEFHETFHKQAKQNMKREIDVLKGKT